MSSRGHELVQKLQCRVMWLYLLACIVAIIGQATASYSISTRTGALPFFLYLNAGNRTIAVNDGVVSGRSNTSVGLIYTDYRGIVTNNDTSGTILSQLITPTIARVEVNTSSEYVGARFALAKNEKIFGLWEYPWNGSLLNKDIMFDLKGVGNADGINWSNARAPFFLSSAGYGVYIDTLAMGSFDFKQAYHCQFIFNVSSLVYYVILPPEKSATNFKSIITQYMNISAKIEMPPDSAYGPTFWNDDFEQDFHEGWANAEENIFDVVQHLQENEIHATSIVDDRPFGTGNMSWGNFDFDPKFYPDPQGMVKDLSREGYDLQVWAANRAFDQTKMFKIGSERGWFFPEIDSKNFRGPAFDLKIPEANAWMRQALEYFTSIGVKGFKIDRGEEEEMPAYEQNYQMSLFTKLLYDVMVKKWGKGKFYNFARSAVDRSRQHTAIWNGDAHADWQRLQYTVASGIRAGILGFSMWGSDTGGYNRQPEYILTEELWARWMWFSTFSPVYEIMVGTGNTPWYPPFSSNSTRLMKVLKQTTRLHHLLRPYIKSYTYRATQDGVPLLRALILEAPTDTRGYEIADQYFFGQAFLVAPIVKKRGKRSVYFPIEGEKYLEYFGKTKVYSGGGTVNVTMNLDRIPVYVRAGAIVPRGDTYRGNNKWTNNWSPKLEVEFFPSFDVPKTVFLYWNGKQEVPITMTTSKVRGEVTIEYGDLGIEEAKLILWMKGGAVRAEMIPWGGIAKYQDVLSVF